MSRTFHNGERRIRVHGVLKAQPELRQLVQAYVELKEREAEAAAEAEHKRRQHKRRSDPEITRTSSPENAHDGDAA